MPAPPTSASSPTTEFAPLRSSSTSSNSTSVPSTSSPAKPGQSGASSAPWSSITNSQTISTLKNVFKRVLTLVLQVKSDDGNMLALHTCRGLSGRQRSSGEVALPSAGFTVGSSVGDCWNLTTPRGTTASFPPSVVTYWNPKKSIIILYRPTIKNKNETFAHHPCDPFH